MPALDDWLSGDDARMQAALEKLTAADLPALMEAARSHEPDTRALAATALGGARFGAAVSGDVVRALLPLSADPDSNVRAAAFHALGQQRAEEGVTPLLFALSDRSPYLARLAADALIQIGEPAVLPLIEALDHEVESHVRVNVARALALIADTRAIPALFRALEDESH
ncbi:MAG: HEAT repeat domain-containing protein [Anaerolineales bacterium]